MYLWCIVTVRCLSYLCKDYACQNVAPITEKYSSVPEMAMSISLHIPLSPSSRSQESECLHRLLIRWMVESYQNYKLVKDIYICEHVCAFSYWTYLISTASDIGFNFKTWSGMCCDWCTCLQPVCKITESIVWCLHVVMRMNIALPQNIQSSEAAIVWKKVSTTENFHWAYKYR